MGEPRLTPMQIGQHIAVLYREGWISAGQATRIIKKVADAVTPAELKPLAVFFNVPEDLKVRDHWLDVASWYGGLLKSGHPGETDADNLEALIAKTFAFIEPDPVPIREPDAPLAPAPEQRPEEPVFGDPPLEAQEARKHHKKQPAVGLGLPLFERFAGKTTLGALENVLHWGSFECLWPPNEHMASSEIARSLAYLWPPLGKNGRASPPTMTEWHNTIQRQLFYLGVRREVWTAIHGKDKGKLVTMDFAHPIGMYGREDTNQHDVIFVRDPEEAWLRKDIAEVPDTAWGINATIPAHKRPHNLSVTGKPNLKFRPQNQPRKKPPAAAAAPVDPVVPPQPNGHDRTQMFSPYRQTVEAIDRLAAGMPLGDC